MAGEFLHEPGVAVGACMLASRIGIYDVGINFGGRKHALGPDFLYDHFFPCAALQKLPRRFFVSQARRKYYNIPHAFDHV
jgi:hypothetical protein